MSLAIILAVIILAVDFAIAIWDGYASGYNIGMMRNSKNKASTLQNVAAYSGLGLGFVGAAYVLVVVISIIAYVLGYVGAGTVSYALAFDFIVLGVLIIGFGIMVTIQSIEFAVRERSAGSIVTALWNTFAMAWDVSSYIEGFNESVALLRRGGSRDLGDTLLIVIVAVLVAFFIVHAAYRHGLSKANAIKQ